MEDRIVRCQEATQITGLKRNIRLNLEAKGLFPKRIRLTERMTGYSYNELIGWVSEKVSDESLRIEMKIADDGQARRA